jgi:hypothetical protein
MWAERLEYGKLCVSPDGPVVDAADHGLLGATPGFPAEINADCNPRTLGSVRDPNDPEPTPPEARHATLLRPVMLRAGPGTVMARVGRRPEQPARPASRPHWLGRYLFTAEASVSPGSLLGALASEPFAGLSAPQVRELSPLAISTSDPPALDQEGRAFVGGALQYLLSAIPLTVTEPVGEDLFFTWVDALWRLLPGTLRVLFSAGWGVGTSYSGELNLVFSPGVAATSARFDRASCRWVPPREVVRLAKDGTASHVPFSDERLVPARLFCIQAFEWPREDPHPRVTKLACSEEGQRLAAAATKQRTFARWPALGQAAVAGAFRAPGTLAYDQRGLRRLERWLEEGPREGEPADAFKPWLCQLVFEQTLNAAADLVIAALEQPVSASRAEAVMDFLLTDARVAAVRARIQVSVGPGSLRAQLLQQIGLGDLSRALHAMARSIGEGRAPLLPPDASARLEAMLRAEGTGRNVAMHLRLASAERLPAPYQRWLEGQGFELAVEVMANSAYDAGEAVANLRRWSSHPAMEMLGRWVNRGLPEPADAETFGRLPQETQERFRRCWTECWRKTARATAASRDWLIPWFELFRVPVGDDPLLEIAAGLSSDSGVGAIADLVRSDGVPPSLVEKVAAAALRSWPWFRTHVVQSRATWRPITDLWPPDVRRLLLDATSAEEAGDGNASLEKAAQEVRWSPEGLDALISDWMGHGRQGDRSFVAPRLLAWARRLPALTQGARGAADLLRQALTGRWSEARLRGPAGVDLTTAAAMIRAAGPAATIDQRGLWQTAREGWQLRLLLESFPETDFPASAVVLGALVEERAWLSSHLVRIQGNRRERFVIASLEFHELDYRHQSEHRFRDEFRQSVLWAAFAGVPIESQGSLGRALQVYGLNARDQVELCRRYLLPFEGSSDEERARETVTSEFVFPILIDACKETKLAAILLEAIAAAGAQPRGRARRLFRSYEVVRARTDDGPPVGETPDGRFVITPSFWDLLRLLVRDEHRLGGALDALDRVQAW